MKLPPLRMIDIVPVEHEGEQLFCLNDPGHFVDDQLILSPPAVFVASMLDGENGVEDIRRAFHAQSGGVALAAEQIFEIVDHLDRTGFLQTEHFDDMLMRVREEYRRADARPAAHAGRSYPADPDELRDFLDGQFVREGGPGKRQDSPPAGAGVLPGLIVPHIDFGRGGHSYAHGYSALCRHAKPDTVIVFGVAHAAEPVPFILTRKPYETPLGTLEIDEEIISVLEEACTWDPYAFEFAHRGEHSIEFQAVMLAHLYGTDVKIVPILCSMFGEDFDAGEPTARQPIANFLRACNESVRSSDKKVSVLASADLAHVGRRFGDPFDIDEAVVEAVAQRDSEDLSHVEAIDAEKFYASVNKDGNRRKVCGINCIYSALRALDGVATVGEALHYDYAEDPAGGIVSFASVALRA